MRATTCSRASPSTRSVPVAISAWRGRGAQPRLERRAVGEAVDDDPLVGVQGVRRLELGVDVAGRVGGPGDEPPQPALELTLAARAGPAG